MMKGQNVLYVRVSSADQNTARQEVNAEEFDQVFKDHASGRDTNRPGLQQCLQYLRSGDTLTVDSIDRLARDIVDLNTIVRELTARGVNIQFTKEHLSFAGEADNPTNVLLLNLLGAVAQFERAKIRERQAEGIAAAKAAGKFKGGQPKLTREQAEQLRADHAEGASVASIARKYGITRATAYKYLAD